MMKVNYILVLCFLWGGIVRNATGNYYPQHESTVKYNPGHVGTESGVGHAKTTNQNGHFSQDRHSNVKRAPRQNYGDDDFISPSDDTSFATSIIGTTPRPLTPATIAEVDLFSPSTTNTSALSSSTTSKPPKHVKMRCPPEELDKCLTKMPPMGNSGIPATLGAVQTACKAFKVGMECVHDWAKKCLGKAGQDKMRQSVGGAHEIFTFLCNDKNFRDEYLKHGGCFRTISHLYDRCSREFIERLRKFGTKENSTTLCCFRQMFIKIFLLKIHSKCPCAFAALIFVGLVILTILGPFCCVQACRCMRNNQQDNH